MSTVSPIITLNCCLLGAIPEMSLDCAVTESFIFLSVSLIPAETVVKFVIGSSCVLLTSTLLNISVLIPASIRAICLASIIYRFIYFLKFNQKQLLFLHDSRCIYHDSRFSNNTPKVTIAYRYGHIVVHNARNNVLNFYG